MGIPEIVLHVGTTKTGTTSIQRSFAAASTLGAGILYPRAGRGRGSAHHNLAYEVGTQFRTRGRFEPPAGSWEELLSEIERCGAIRAIVSSEAFSFLEAGEVSVLADRLASRSIRVVLYLRRPDAWIHSGFVQHAKFGLTDLNPDNYLRGFPNLAARRWRARSQLQIYRAWSQAFGPARTRLFLYQRDMIGDNVVRHFAGVCGVDLANIPMLDVRANVKVPLKTLVAATVVRRTCAEKLGREHFRVSATSAAKISQFFAGRPDFVESYSLFSADHARHVLAMCAADTERLYELLGPDSPRFAGIGDGEYADFVPDALDLARRFHEDERRFVKRMIEAIVQSTRRAG